MSIAENRTDFKNTFSVVIALAGINMVWGQSVNIKCVKYR